MVLQANLFSEFIGDHLFFYFTRETLCTTLNLNGYEVLSCDAVRYDYVLSAVVRKRRPTDVSRFALAEERLREELNSYVGRFGHRKVAVWGAGHQAFAVLALTGLAAFASATWWTRPLSSRGGSLRPPISRSFRRKRCSAIPWTPSSSWLPATPTRWQRSSGETTPRPRPWPYSGARAWKSSPAKKPDTPVSHPGEATHRAAPAGSGTRCACARGVTDDHGG